MKLPNFPGDCAPNSDENPSTKTQKERIKLTNAQGLVDQAAARQCFTEYFEKSIEYYERRIYDSATCEDLAQEAMFKILRARVQFDNAEDQVKWVYGVIRNNFINYLRSKKTRPQQLSEGYYTADEQHGEIDEEFDAHDVREEWDRILDRLPDKQKKIVRMKSLTKSSKATSEELDIPIRTVNRHLFEAEIKLRTALGLPLRKKTVLTRKRRGWAARIAGEQTEISKEA
jgi:RNA polymerase sigma-70 factor (ECF subfamily)